MGYREETFTCQIGRDEGYVLSSKSISFDFASIDSDGREFSPVKEKDKTIKAKIEFKTLPDIRQHRAYLLRQNAHQKGWPTKYAKFFCFVPNTRVSSV